MDCVIRLVSLEGADFAGAISPEMTAQRLTVRVLVPGALWPFTPVSPHVAFPS